MAIDPLHTILPFYHAICDHELSHIKHLYRIRTKAEFERDLDYLLAHYVPLGLGELMDLVSKGHTKKPCFHLTFDDGLAECYHVIAPILQKKGIPATFFLNAEFLDNRDLFFRFKASLLVEAIIHLPHAEQVPDKLQSLLNLPDARRKSAINQIMSIPYSQRWILDEAAKILEVDFAAYLDQEKPYLENIQIREMIRQGFTFGAHSLDHPLFNELSPSEQFDQLKVSVDHITMMFGLNYRCFSFPFTDHGIPASFFRRIYHPDTPVVDISFGSAGIKRDAFSMHLQRLPIEAKKGSLATIMKKEQLIFPVKKILGKDRIRR